MSNSKLSQWRPYEWVLGQIAENSEMVTDGGANDREMWVKLKRRAKNGVVGVYPVEVYIRLARIGPDDDPLYVVGEFWIGPPDTDTTTPDFHYLSGEEVLAHYGKRDFEAGDARYEKGVLKVKPDVWLLRSPVNLLALFQAYVKLAAFRRKETLFSL